MRIGWRVCFRHFRSQARYSQRVKCKENGRAAHQYVALKKPSVCGGAVLSNSPDLDNHLRGKGEGRFECRERERERE